MILRPIPDRVDAQRLPRAFAPGRQREQALVDLAVDEGVGVALPVSRLHDIALERRALLEARRPVRRALSRRDVAGPLGRRGWRGFGASGQDLGIDEKAAPLPGDQEPFLDQ